jgi:hypothetical protein
MVMRPRANRGLHRYGSCPKLVCAGAGVRNRSRARHAGRLRCIGIQFTGSNDADSVLLPVGH